MSSKMDKILKDLWNSYDSAEFALAEYISMIADGGEDECGTDEFLVTCIMSLRDACDATLKRLEDNDENA